MTTPELPDAEQVAIEWLLTSSALMSLLGDRIYSEPIEDVEWPFLTVTRISGTPDTRHWIDRPTLQIAAWSEDRAEARDICELAVVWMTDMDMNQPDAVVTAVSDISGGRPLPDPETGRPRFIAEVQMVLHPTAVVGSS